MMRARSWSLMSFLLETELASKRLGVGEAIGIPVRIYTDGCDEGVVSGFTVVDCSGLSGF